MSNTRVKLTKTFIDQLDLIPAIYRDSELIGFAVRVNASYKTYIVEKKVKGKSVRSTIGLYGNLTLAQARELARKQLTRMTRGVNPNESTQKEIIDEKVKTELLCSIPTLYEAYQNYIKHKTLKPRTILDYNVVMHKYLCDWKDIKMDEISRSMVQSIHTKLSKDSKAQANMAMRVYRAIYNFSVEHYLDENDKPTLESHNPVLTLNNKNAWNKIKRRKTYINEDQLPDWIRAVFNYDDRGQHLETNRDFLLTLILTGFRRDECESIPWTSIDLKYKRITSIDPKNGEPHTLPMGDFLFELMKKRRANVQSDWVFPSAKSVSGHITNISKVRGKINASCGVAFTFHDLRRTFSSIAENLDYERYTIKRLLNHKEKDDYDVTSSYIQVSDKTLREAMNAIENIILGPYKPEYTVIFQK
ncbi:tyrosine-type recombinase/integrase [Acinetobacter sp. ANC 4648]|uniref:tyrosine-type recombinase/integrase n=1 Tax=Acinetobacter sp. ANC 4648 TaxID=1977875 RepID=UPI000A34D016|nr:integrase family protein [Acinetobacter sp. ANC 4648]OTG82389.1 integrase [Acinetobacter sp. ANC 4648]